MTRITTITIAGMTMKLIITSSGKAKTTGSIAILINGVRTSGKITGLGGIAVPMQIATDIKPGGSGHGLDGFGEVICRSNLPTFIQLSLFAMVMQAAMA
jgi:hypothetical protein